MDEYGNMKKGTWGEHVRPALSTPGRPGWAWFIGVPEGRNHYFDLWQDAPERANWERFTWPTSDINPEEAEAAKADMDLLTWQQEYTGAFISFEGQAYYAFCDDNLDKRVKYSENFPLIFAFDFNRQPGVALVMQERPWGESAKTGTCTLAIDEVFIERNSNTQKVSKRLAADWAFHKGEVRLYGDATGHAGKSSGLHGSDWDIVKEVLKPVFHDRLRDFVGRSNPPERSRVNAMNSRLQSADGNIRLIINPTRCPRFVRDLEGVATNSKGEIDKSDKDSPLTHISDGGGYYIADEWPCLTGEANSRRVLA